MIGENIPEGATGPGEYGPTCDDHAGSIASTVN
jgi:hypothetical protein